MYVAGDEGYIEGTSWKILCALTAALSLVPLITLIAITAGNHRGFSRNLLQGILVTSVCFVLLAVVAPLRFRSMRRVKWNGGGLLIRSFGGTRHIPWDEVEDVTVTSRSGGEGPTWFLPTLRLRTGKPRMISALSSANNRSRADENAKSLAEVVKDHQSGRATWTG
jgi:Bacterial PH domain